MAIEIRAVVITVSDRCARGEQADESGAVLAELLRLMNAEVVAQEIVSDDLEPLIVCLRGYAYRPDVNLIVTTGGTGVAPRDNTPEATRAVITHEVPGIAEAMRMETRSKTPTSMLSRGVCGYCSATLVVNLPGSPKGVRECFAVIEPIIPHAVALLAGRPHKDAK